MRKNRPNIAQRSSPQLTRRCRPVSSSSSASCTAPTRNARVELVTNVPAAATLAPTLVIVIPAATGTTAIAAPSWIPLRNSWSSIVIATPSVVSAAITGLKY